MARRNMGDFKGAFTDYTRVLELNQDILTAHVHGWKRPAIVPPSPHGDIMSGGFKEARADLAMAIQLSKKRLNPQLAEAYFVRALARMGVMVFVGDKRVGELATRERGRSGRLDAPGTRNDLTTCA
jgi:hypothetical protein